MDPQRFDALSRALATGASRRWFARAIAGLGAGVLVRGLSGRRSADASGTTDPSTPSADGCTDCGGACIDPQTDENHCGGCGQACAPDRTCCAGACVDSAPLSPPFSGYPPDDDPDLMNPERGMYFEAFPGEATIPNPDNPGGPEIPDPRRQSHTIVPMWLELADVCGTNLVWKGASHVDTTPVLGTYAAMLEQARDKGVKVLFRPRYDRKVGECHVPSTCRFNNVGEPVFHADTLDRQKNHIDAVAKMLAEYKDVVAFIQAGYLGNWGEWNTGHSSHPTCTPYTPANAPMLYCCTDRIDIIDHVVSAYAAAGIAQHVELRTPVFAQEALAGNASAKVGLHNDCFMSSIAIDGSDSGTYSDFFCCHPQPCDGPQHCENPQLCEDPEDPEDCGSKQNFGNETDARDWAKGRTDNFSFGGETCPRNPTGSERWRFCSNMIGANSEPASLHMNYLNGDFVKAAVDAWETGDADGATCYDEIRRRLGYRFEVSEVTGVEYTATVAAGQAFQVRVQVANTGWARLHKPRQAKIVLRSGSLAYPFEIPEASGGAVAGWAPGQTTLLSVTACPPPTGRYEVRLWIPDPDAKRPNEDVPEPENPDVDEMDDPDKKRRIDYAVKLATKRNGGNVFDPATGENNLGVEIEVL